MCSQCACPATSHVACGLQPTQIVPGLSTSRSMLQGGLVEVRGSAQQALLHGSHAQAVQRVRMLGLQRQRALVQLHPCPHSSPEPAAAVVRVLGSVGQAGQVWCEECRCQGAVCYVKRVLRAVTRALSWKHTRLPSGLQEATLKPLTRLAAAAPPVVFLLACACAEASACAKLCQRRRLLRNGWVGNPTPNMLAVPTHKPGARQAAPSASCPASLSCVPRSV